MTNEKPNHYKTKKHLLILHNKFTSKGGNQYEHKL